MPDPEDREIIREPHPEVVRWLDTLCPWPADKPFPLTPLEAWYVMQGYTVAPAARITMEDMLQMPGKLEGGDGGIMLWNPWSRAQDCVERRRMPRLWVMSDLHLEAVPHPEAFRPARPAFDVLVVAGDLWEGSSARALAIVAELAGGKPAIFVLGNHEPWHRDLAEERAAACRAADRHGITLLDDDEAECAGVRFVGGTLWADGELAGKEKAPKRVTGEQIYVDRSRGARWITNGDEAALHRETRDVIATALTRPRDNRPVVVVTHHAPHPCCLPPAYRTGWAAGNAASDLSYLTDAGLAALWVHGHVHHSIDLVRPGGTRIVCNAAGPGFSNADFQDDLVIDV